MTAARRIREFPVVLFGLGVAIVIHVYELYAYYTQRPGPWNPRP